MTQDKLRINPRQVQDELVSTYLILGRQIYSIATDCQLKSYLK